FRFPLCLQAPKQKLCNYTDLHTGAPWFCYKPKKLTCVTRVTLIGSRQRIKPWKSGSLKDGATVRQFNKATAISQYLKGKVLHLYGGSTARQWFEYLISTTPDLKMFDLKSPKQTGPFLALDYKNNILVTFPAEVYIRRLLSIRRAVERLLTRAPGTLVIIRTTNPKALSLYETDQHVVHLCVSAINLKVSIPASGPAHVQVRSQFDYFYRSDFNFPWAFSGGVKQTMQSSPSGYYYQGAWRSLDGTTVHQFNTITAISQCLKNKALHLYGDSTIRQWFEYLNQSLPDLKEFDLRSSNQTGPFLALDYANNILLTFRSHGPPIRFRIIPISNLHYIANELDRVVGGTNTVVVIGIWSHFSTFPIEVYIRRLLNIRKAVVRLLSRSPDTLVIIRTANPKALTLYETLTNSDWYSLQRDKVLRAIFKRVKVKLVDAWEMSIAHHLPHSLHPQPPIVKNMIAVVLSYICPKTENL
ncbi:NXPE family member 3-like, partial [Xiphophorus hellerii]|uniref:NXPE family member 3-like n=1 Tax=Xiphophorus hellerii TaxID=8084 RepID=UPI0013B3FDFA